MGTVLAAELSLCPTQPYLDKIYVLWPILLPLFPRTFYYVSVVLTSAITPPPVTTWLDRKHQAPYYQKTVLILSLESLSGLVFRPPACSTSPLPSCTLWPCSISFQIQSKIMSPVLLWEGNFNMDVDGSRTSPSLLAGCPEDETACSVQSQLLWPCCVQLSCPHRASVTQSPEDSPCVQCLLSAVIMPNKATWNVAGVFESCTRVEQAQMLSKGETGTSAHSCLIGLSLHSQTYKAKTLVPCGV